ncbi:hypothetical protein TSUD_245240 [Trifolium subterraneum]|uniref:Uncharacterized protein n=1 Tax=Trifolium subterraneum TaxID=3900 RepID=A0A2Z6PEX5_TRISU|nr:hypothetical protein TSUD_245240 [Trifolium subterraneum]
MREIKACGRGTSRVTACGVMKFFDDQGFIVGVRFLLKSLLMRDRVMRSSNGRNMMSATR